MKTTLASVVALLSSVNAVAVSLSGSQPAPYLNATTTSTTSASTSPVLSSSTSSLASAAAGRPVFTIVGKAPLTSSSSSSSVTLMPVPVNAAVGRPVYAVPTTTAAAGRPVYQAPATTASTNAAIWNLYCAIYKLCSTTPIATPKTTSTTSTKKSSTTTTSSTTTKKTTTSTTSTTPPATPTANLNGCFADFYPTSRAMTGSSVTSDSITPQVCATFCTNSGYAYSGVEYGNQCYCAHAWPSTWATNCNMKCAGDSTQFCGGPNALNVMYTAPSTTATTSSKRGLCWPYNNDPAIFKLFDPTKETWVYNWEMWSPTGFLASYAGAQYVGLVRSPARLPDVATYYNDNWQTSPILLGFNEPDLAGSDTYVTVADAVTYWKQYFLPLRAKYGTKLGAPAVTNGVGTNWGIDWLNKFNAACSDTTTGTAKSCFDFIPLHWYGSTLSDFQNWVVAFHNAYPTYDLWITEFTFTNQDAASVAALVKQAITWLDAQSYVARYSLFGPMDAANMAGITAGAMVNDAHTALTQVGKVYAGLA